MALDPPKIEAMPERHFAGLMRRYDMQTRSAIPGQWRDYNQSEPLLKNVIPNAWYGVCYNFGADMSFDYLSGMEVTDPAGLPQGVASVTIPAGAYARFATKGHISTMPAIWGEIFQDWLKRPDYRPRPGPSVEYYPPEFDGMTGDGGFEIWVPIEAQQGF